MATKPSVAPFDPHTFQFGQYLGQQPDFDPVQALDLYKNTPYGQFSGGPFQAASMGPFGQQQPQMPAPPSGDPEHQGMMQRFLQSIDSPQGRDSMMAGAITSLAGTNPQLAVQLAQQMKEHQSQRDWQQQQNELQRQSMQQRYREQALIQRENKDQATFQSKAGKLDAGFRAAGIDPTPVAAELGPPSPENIDQWQSRLQVLVAQDKAAKQARADVTTDLNNKSKILQNVASGKFINSPYTTKGNPKYDADLAENQIPSLLAEHKTLEAGKAEMRTARLAREKALLKIATRNADGSPNPAALRAKKLLQESSRHETEIVNYQRQLANAKATAAAFSSLDDTDPNKQNANAAVENWTKLLADAQQAKQEADDSFDELSGAPPKEAPAGTTPEEIQQDPDIAKVLKKYPGATLRVPPPATQHQYAAGSDEDLYWKFVDKFGTEKANAAWAERHGNAPPPPR